MAEIIIEVPGVPIAKKRPRFARRGKFVTTYNDQETEEGKFILLSRSQVTQRAPEGVPVTLSAAFYFPIPKSTSKKKKRKILDEGHDEHVKKPDLDNCLKFVKDCLNGLAWHDDSQVWKIDSFKGYNEEPRTFLIISWDETIDSRKINHTAVPHKRRAGMEDI